MSGNETAGNGYTGDPTPAGAEIPEAVEAAAADETPLPIVQEEPLAQFLGQHLPVAGYWFEVVKTSGGYMMLQFKGATTKTKRMLGHRKPKHKARNG